MDNLSLIWSATLARSPGISSARVNSYAGINTNRRARYDARADRRWGDWGILEVPTSLLWLDALSLAADVDDGLGYPAPVADIWP